MQHCSKKLTLFKKKVIKKIVALAMLIVFAFSITPTIVFHNWLADHSDTVRKTSSSTGEQLGKITFHCHCDNIVAESPFTEPGKLIAQQAVSFFVEEQLVTIVQITTAAVISYSLRGPPVV